MKDRGGKTLSLSKGNREERESISKENKKIAKIHRLVSGKGLFLGWKKRRGDQEGVVK